MIVTRRRAWLAATLVQVVASPLAAQRGPALPDSDPEPTAQLGSIVGHLLNAESGEPVAAASVALLELRRGELSHEDGSFHFDRVSPGLHTVSVQRLGFLPAQTTVTVSSGDTARVELRLTPSAIHIPGVVVTGTGRARSAVEAYRPTTVLDDGELRRGLGASIAATLADRPGIAQRYNGPVAAQPVIRGLGGDRVLVLEDGARTGDLASSSADHAVTIEPLTAERIEVLRGPAGLIYGSNALGGVINVVREEIPRSLPETVSGTVTARAASVDRGLSAGAAVEAPLGSVAARAELSGRVSGDTRTPLGELPSTDALGYNAAAAASWIHGSGLVGAGVRDYSIRYGVPGSFQGSVIPGAHEGGVEIDLRRTSFTADAALFAPVGPFEAFDWTGRYTRFEQDELEPSGSVGTRFGQLTATSDLTARHRHRADGLLVEGTAGFSASWQDLRSSGNSGTRPAEEVGLAGFAFEEIAWRTLRLQLGGRYDHVWISPLDGSGPDRSFGAVSGSASALVEPLAGVVFGASVSRAFRPPSITELYSDGPHLADYTFNVGNPELGAEYGHGIDLFTRLNRPGISAEAAVYRNWIDDYIHYRPTGELDPRLGRFPVYQAAAADAVLSGIEGLVQWEVVPRLVMDASASYVRGERSDDAEPLPAIPPAQARLAGRWDTGSYFLSLGLSATARQDRVSEFETPTAGHALLDAGSGLRWSVGGKLHTLSLQLLNLTDREYRDHLSRIKEVAPQPGRSLELLYRFGF